MAETVEFTERIVRRLQYRFYSFLFDETNDPVKGKILTFRSYMPMIYDDVYHLPNSMTYEDARNRLILEGKMTTEADDLLQKKSGYFTPYDDPSITEFIHSFYSPIPNDWNVTYAITQGNTVTVKKLFNSSGSGVSSVFSKEYKGVDVVTLEIREKEHGSFVLEDNKLPIIEIVLERASAETPWIYYGNTRRDLATKIGRKATHIGGMQPSVVPASALRINYRYDGTFEVVVGYLPIIPFVSAFYAPNFGFSSEMFDISMMWEVLDGKPDLYGNVRVAIRTATMFTVSALSIDIGMAYLGMVAAQTGWNAESYKNIHSRAMEYQVQNYEEKQTIKNTTFVFFCESKLEMNNLYNRLSSSFFLLYQFIDYNTCRFFFYSFTLDDSSSLPNLLFSSIYGSSPSAIPFSIPFLCSNNSKKYTPSFRKCFEKSNDILTTIFKEDVSLSKEKNYPDYKTIKYCAIFLSDMQFGRSTTIGSEPIVTLPELDDSRAAISSFPVSINDGAGNETSNVFLACGAFSIESKDNVDIVLDAKGNTIKYSEDIFDRAKKVFNPNACKLLMDSSGYSCYVFSFLDLLMAAVKEEVDHVEDEILVGLGEVDIDVLKRQCKDMVSPASFVTGDYNKDGKAYQNITDHIYSLYGSGTGINEENGIEMRYWRKICPIGQLYKISGIAKNIKQNYFDVYFDLYQEGKEGSILVYVEYLSKTNIAIIKEDQKVDVYGVCLLPDYFLGAKYDGFLDFTTEIGIAPWYRLNWSTIDYIYKNKDIFTKDLIPIFVVRSNLFTTFDFDASTFVGPYTEVQHYIPPFLIVPYLGWEINISQWFLGWMLKSKIYYRQKNIVNIVDGVEDCIVDTSLIQTGDDAEKQLLIGNSIFAFTNNELDLTIQNIQFDIDVLDGNGNYQYEVMFTKKGDTKEYRLWKFHSGIALSSKRVYINLKSPYKFVCETVGSNKKDLFVRTSYSSTVIENISEKDVLESTYDFKWLPSDFYVQAVYLNGKKVDSSTYVVIPEEAMVRFGVDIDTSKELVEIELVNISNLSSEKIDKLDFSPVKEGNSLFIRRLSDGIVDSYLGPPKFSNVKVNFGKNFSVERTECYFYHNSSGRRAKHYIAPAYGFDYISGDGSWYMTIDNEEESGGRILSGNIISPYFYVDRFAAEDDIYRQVDKTDENLVSIDRIYWNIASRTIPFVTTQSIYFPYVSKPPSLQKISSMYSGTKQKLTIVYDSDGIMNQKFSYTDFKNPKDYEKTVNGQTKSYVTDNLRLSIPLSTSKTEIIKDRALFVGFADEPEFNVSNVIGLAGYLSGLIVYSEPPPLSGGTSGYSGYSGTGGYSEPLLSNSMEVHAKIDGRSFEPFGYTTASGEKFAKIFGAKKVLETGKYRSYVKMPDSRGLTSIKLVKPKWSNFGKITKVEAEIINEYYKGSSPQIMESSDGVYFVFFLSEDAKKIMLVSTKYDGYGWNRPIVEHGATKDGTPIAIYQNSNAVFANLDGTIRNTEDYACLLFFYDSTVDGVVMISVNRTLTRKLYMGVDGETRGQTTGKPEDKAGEEDSIPLNNASWADYFKNGQNVRRVIIGTTAIFSVDSTPRGTIYIAFVTKSGEIQIMYNKRIRLGSEEEQSDWIDSYVNIVHKDSKLKKILGESKISSLNISYNVKDDMFLYIFISTDNNYLYLLPVPEAMLRRGTTDADKDILEKNQNMINENTPVLIIGDRKSFSAEDEKNGNIHIKGSVKGLSFPPQRCAIEWSTKGSCMVFYYDDKSQMRCVESNNFNYWKENANV